MLCGGVEEVEWRDGRGVEMTPELKEAQDRYLEAEGWRIKLEVKVRELRKVRDALCRHQDGEKIKEITTPGSYYDKEQTHRFFYCKICGHEMRKAELVYVGGYG